MFRKLILSASLGLAALSALAPTVASAQSYGGWNGSGYADRGYGERYDGRDRGRSSYGYDRGDHARQRWIQHRRWEQEARRRHWQERRWDHRDDRRGWNGDHY